MDFFTNNYKELVKNELEAKKLRFGQRFTFQSMAKACGVQKTYISRVFNGDAQLSPDQLYLCGDYLNLSDLEFKYLQSLYEYERSAIDSRRKILKRKLESIRQESLSSEQHLSVPTMDSNQTIDYSEYYLDPNMRLVHIFLTIPQFRKNHEGIKERIHLSDEQLTTILTKLEHMKLIGYMFGEYSVINDHLHLSKSSSIEKASSKMLRVKSLENERSENYQLGVVFSADIKTKNEIQHRFLNFLKGVEDLVKTSPAEDVFQMQFDLLHWS